MKDNGVSASVYVTIETTVYVQTWSRFIEI